MILDGRSGFGTSGTARVVYNSTFTPGRGTGSPTINAAALAIGGLANVDFVDDHFEVTSGDCIQVVTAATVSLQGNGHACNPVIRLCSNSDSFCSAASTIAGNDIAVRNVTTSVSNGVVVQDDRNSVTISNHVSDYSTAVDASTITVHGTLTLPNQNATTVFSGPSGTFSTAAAPTFRLLTPDDLPAPSGFSYVQDDFYGGGNAGGAIGSLGWNVANVGTGATQVGITAFDQNHPGVIQQKTGATNGNICNLILSTLVAANLPIFNLNTTAWHATFIWALNSHGTNVQVKVRLGFGSDTMNPPTAGIYFENVSGNTAADWSGVAKASGTMITTMTGTTALDTSTPAVFHRFEMVNDGSGSNLKFYIDGSPYVTVTSNLPSTTTALLPLIQLVNTDPGSVDKHADIDYFSFQIGVTR
ncbi:MAG TPA: hypothetical protein VGW33_05935 [Terriglobia bacterium]|nr:hypothetical protein [Terriglobia bacterium]